MLEAFAKAIEARDRCTSGHSERVTAYTLALASVGGLDPATREVVRRGGRLHDIGKVGIPDGLLQKPGSLDPDERELIESHVTIGYQMLSGVACLRDALPAQAELLYTNILDIQRRVLGESHPDTLTSMSNLALTYFSQRKYVEAEGLLRDALRIFEKTAPDSWRRYNSQSMLGASIAGQGKYAEAEALLVSGYEGLVQRQATIPVESRSALKEAGQRIVQLYQSWSKPEKAAEWITKLQQANLWSALIACDPAVAATPHGAPCAPNLAVW